MTIVSVTVDDATAMALEQRAKEVGKTLSAYLEPLLSAAASDRIARLQEAFAIADASKSQTTAPWKRADLYER